MWEKAKSEGYFGVHVIGMHTEVDWHTCDERPSIEYGEIEDAAWDWYHSNYICDCHVNPDFPEHFGEIINGFNDIGYDTSDWSFEYTMHMERMENLPYNPLADS